MPFLFWGLLTKAKYYEEGTLIKGLLRNLDPKPTLDTRPNIKFRYPEPQIRKPHTSRLGTPIQFPQIPELSSWNPSIVPLESRVFWDARVYPVMNNPNQDGQSSSGTSPFPGPVGVGCPRNVCRVQREGCGAWYRYFRSSC